MAGYSQTPLVRKLGIKPGFNIALVFAPPGYANELDLPLKDILGIVIKTNDKAGHYFNTVTLNLLDRIQEVTAIL